VLAVGNKQVICDECGYEFTANILVEEQPDGSEEWYMKCPKCGEEYPSCRISPRGVDIRNELHDMAESGNEERVAELQKEMKDEVENLTDGGDDDGTE